MPDVDFYRLYNGLWARDLMPCLCRDFCDFHKSLPCFFAIFCRDFLLSLTVTVAILLVLCCQFSYKYTTSFCWEARVQIFFFWMSTWYCWLGLLTCKTVSRITYTVLVEMLNPAQSNPECLFDRRSCLQHVIDTICSFIRFPLWFFWWTSWLPVIFWACYNVQGSHAYWKVLESHFGPGKSWKLKFKVLKSPGKISLKITRQWNLPHL